MDDFDVTSDLLYEKALFSVSRTWASSGFALQGALIGMASYRVWLLKRVQSGGGGLSSLPRNFFLTF